MTLQQNENIFDVFLLIISLAMELIERMRLKLTVNHSAEMAMCGGFEVVYA